MQLNAEELEHRIWQAATDLRNAAAGDRDTWYYLSTAIDSIRRATGSYHRISGRQRGILLAELLQVRRQAPSLFANPSAQLLAVKGIDALAAIIINWADADDEREHRDRYRMANIRDSARILQNMCHNASLLLDMAERSRQRRSAAVQDLMAQALRAPMIDLED